MQEKSFENKTARELNQIQRFLILKLKSATNSVIQNANKIGISLDIAKADPEFIKKYIYGAGSEIGEIFQATATVLIKLREIDEEFQVTLVSRMAQQLNATQKNIFIMFLTSHPDDELNKSAHKAFQSNKEFKAAITKFAAPNRS
jgi:hypothetical protein